MLDLVAEELLLRRAVSEGLISQNDVALAKHECSTEQLRWGRCVELLIRRGQLSEEDVQRLAAEIAQTEISVVTTAPMLKSVRLKDAQVSVGTRRGSLGLANTMAFQEQALPASSVFSVSGFPFPQWDKYEFIEVLGQGGMGVVYKARDCQLGRVVALKFIRGDDAAMMQRFLQEARAQALLDHLNICKVYEVGFVDGKPYIAMEFINGLPLDRCSAAMTLLEKLQVMKEVAEALHAAHEHGVIHRDIKPSNILTERQANGKHRPVIMDFGLARETGAGKGLTESGAVIGTPAYMSPEQARGEARRLDRRSDVYSLGATLYDVLTGQPPFDDESVVQVLLKVMNEAAPPLRRRAAAIPEAVDLIVSKCLNKEADQRYPTAQALADDLGRYLSAQRVSARRLSYLYRLRYWARRNSALATVGVLLLCSLLGLAGFGIRTRIVNAQKERAAQQEAKLAELLGQEIKDMEWLLRSARQLPLHDLNREKVIVRERMENLRKEIASYGQLSQGLAHYALGRGHMALHEYPQALAQLQEATRLGLQSAEVHYALGFVLGKHFEQAIYEARLSGGGDWAKKQLQEIEPKYLRPAIASLQKSRTMRLDAPQYLEALIAFYQRNYQDALNHAEAAVKKAPWLYEALKLSGDVHLERALQARDSGRKEEAEREFAGAIESYEAAALVGQSDAEVHEGLAEAWVRKLEMAKNEGLPADAAYKEAFTVSGKVEAAEPQSLMGSLKKAYASYMMAIALLRAHQSPEQPLKACLQAAEEVLKKQPGHPYASEVAASCHIAGSDEAVNRDEDPTPYIRRALELLEPAVKQYPHFLWGINDLAVSYFILGESYQTKGNPAAKAMVQKSLEYAAAAAALDPTYPQANINALQGLRVMVSESRTLAEINDLLSDADGWFGKCLAINRKNQFCYETHFAICTQAAYRIFQEGQDPQPLLKRALADLAQAQSLGSKGGGESMVVLAPLVDARDKLRHKQDPTAALADVQNNLSRCYAIAPKNSNCRCLDARAEWVRGEWLSLQGQPALPSLKAALAKAVKATQILEKDADAWQTLAEAHLRLARAQDKHASEREQSLSRGLSAVEKVFAINPNHALGLATQGALHLARAQAARDVAEVQLAAQAAVLALERALKSDSMIAHDHAPLLHAARRLVMAPCSG